MNTVRVDLTLEELMSALAVLTPVMDALQLEPGHALAEAVRKFEVALILVGKEDE